jgi:hypothetical protein
MPSLTSYTINNYYEHFRNIEITFTKKISEMVKIISEDVFIKCGNSTFPCIVNSSSMIGAQIIIHAPSSFFEILRKNNQKVFLRFAFKRAEQGTPLTFFIQSKVEGFTALPQKQNLYFFRLSYSTRPPDDLIAILGVLIEEASSNIAKRKEERILATPEALKALKIKDSRNALLLQNGKLMSLLRDISSSGAKVVVAGKAEAFLNKPVTLCIQFDGENDTCNLTGVIKRVDEIKERADFIALGIEFSESSSLKGFKRIVENYLKKTEK